MYTTAYKKRIFFFGSTSSVYGNSYVRPEQVTEHLVKGVAGPGSTGANNSPMLPTWLELGGPGSTPPRAHLRASLPWERVFWLCAVFWRGMFSSWRPYYQLGELTFSYGVIIDIYYDTLPGITKCLLEAISLLVRSYATTKLAFFLPDLCVYLNNSFWYWGWRTSKVKCLVQYFLLDYIFFFL